MIKSSYNIFFQLLKRDLFVFKREYPVKFFDTCIMFITNILVFSYFMPNEGLSDSYGPFILIGGIASFGLIEVVGKVSLLMADIEGERTISNTLIMPIRSQYVFMYTGVYWAITSALLSVLLFPLGKLLLYTRFDLAIINYPKLIIMFITASIFYGFFALWLTSILKGMSGLNSLWMRFIAPMWMFGAYFFSWQSAYELSPVVAYVILIDPMVFIMEGMRSAALGPEDYLPFWTCFIVTWGFILACGTHAIFRLKKRLDCV